MDDRELNRLLREWRAPDAPPDLRPSARGYWRRWLVTGTIHVPVPAAIAALLLVVLWIAAARATPTPAPEPSGQQTSGGELARYALAGPLEGFDAVLVEVNFPPGFLAREHRHPGFIFGYVVDGQMRFAINHEPDKIVPAGGTFFEPDGALHTTFGSASDEMPVRAVVFVVVPTGSPVTGPA